jgi:hypothetical protein
MRLILPEGSCWNAAHAPQQRAACWNSYFYTYFGSDHSQVRPDLRPLSGDESCKALSHVVQKCGGQHPHPKALQRCLRRMLTSGYRPSSLDNEALFTTLASVALRNEISAFDTAREAILQDDVTGSDSAPTAASGDLAAPGASRPQTGRSTELTFNANAWALKTEFVVHSPIDGVTALINPSNWQFLAPLFKETTRLEPKEKMTDFTAPWHGILHEKVVLNWNTAVLQSFDVFLNIDYTVAPDHKVARADYSLRYEKDNQITVDDGYVEAQRESRHYTRYIGYKRLRFVSSFVNCVAPALLTMLLDQDHDGLRDILEREANFGAPLTAAMSATHAPSGNA